MKMENLAVDFVLLKGTRMRGISQKSWIYWHICSDINKPNQTIKSIPSTNAVIIKIAVKLYTYFNSHFNIKTRNIKVIQMPVLVIHYKKCHTNVPFVIENVILITFGTLCGYVTINTILTINSGNKKGTLNIP